MTTAEDRLKVFLSDAKEEIFHSVEHTHEIWREDPFDVAAIHENARSAFQRLLARATTPPGADSGRILLMLGEAGCGKTHLIRAFRNHVHLNGLGFVGYMQMTSGTTNYPKYLLSNLIDSLDQPYYESLGPGSGLTRLSGALAGRCNDRDAIAKLQDGEDLSPDAIAGLVDHAAENLVSQERYADIDLDLVRALLFLRRNSPMLRKRVVKYLRGEDLADGDRRALGGLVPKRAEDEALKLVEHMGRLIRALDSRALVICVDQLEDMFLLPDVDTPFRRTMSTLCAIADQVPSSVIVISCLDDYYTRLRSRLTGSMIDRIERDPTPIRLVSQRNEDEARLIVEHRLGYLYETTLRTHPIEPTFEPIPAAFVKDLASLRTRHIVDLCRDYRARCAKEGRIIDAVDVTLPPPSRTESDADAAKMRFDLEWNDAARAQSEPPEDDADLADLLGWAIEACGQELDRPHRFDVNRDGATLGVRVSVAEDHKRPVLREELHVALCNKNPQGGGLGTQIELAAKKAGKQRIPVLVRCGDFPTGAKTAVVKSLSLILKKGGRKAVIEDGDWRKIAAFRRFQGEHRAKAHFDAWVRGQRHLSGLLPLVRILDLDRLDVPDGDGSGRTNTTPVPPARSSSRGGELASETVAPPSALRPPSGESLPPLPPLPRRPLAIGVTGELVAKEIVIDPETLSAHAAFLGGTGSGKTTLALNIIEQLVLQGVPAVLVDRKGDLAAYARGDVWSEPSSDPEREARRKSLVERLDVHLFTPGHPEGRPLSIALVPDGLAGMTDFDREQAATYAAEAIGGMLDYKHTGRDKALRAILVQAVRLLTQHEQTVRLDLESLIRFIDDESPELVTAVGRLDIKHFQTLVQHLETFKLRDARLLSTAGEVLDAEHLFGLGAHARSGRTRLSIISTKFLGDNASILFWVSQLLLSLTRWVARKPSPTLQAIVLFDEADMYLPAMSQPATKAPMENLLRRARSGGLGVLLATQSPGDLDYKCRDNIRSWFVGRITQKVAIEKMKPLLSDCRVSVEDKLPTQKVGEFHLLQDGGATALRARQAFLRTAQVAEPETVQLAARQRAAIA